MGHRRPRPPLPLASDTWGATHRAVTTALPALWAAPPPAYAVSQQQQASRTTDRGIRLYGGRIAEITPTGPADSASNLWLRAGVEYSRQIRTDAQGQLVVSEHAFAHDLLAFIYWLYKRRADQEPALGYIADLLYTAVIAADLRAFNRHEYRRKPEESDLDVSAAYHALPDRLVTTFRRVRF